VYLTVDVWLLNAFPMTGMRRSVGTRCSPAGTAALVNPPKPTPWPLSPTSWRPIGRLFLAAPPATAALERLATAGLVSSATLSPALTCGVTFNITPTSLRSEVVNGLLGLVVPPVAVYDPVAKGTS